MEKSARILIVDDTELNRDILEGLVASLGHQPMVVDSGKEALMILDKTPKPDLILLDILMPEVSGFDVLKYVKNDEELRRIPTIMISIVDEMKSIVRCIEYGADDFMVKPFNAILLKARINACLEKKEHEDSEKKFNFWLAESYQKLQKAEQIRDEMFNMIVHDMNNSLVMILGEADILLSTLYEKVDQSTLQSLKNINNAGEQIKSLIRGIFDVSQMEKGQIVPKKEQCDVLKVVRETGEQFEATIKRSDGLLRIICEAETLHHELDVALFRRILQNLLANVIKYGLSAENPTVEISVKKQEGILRLTVSDNGPGIPDDQMDKIFHKYYKIKPENRGLGLGLAFCKLAAESMGGRITGSSGENGGAIFTLLLP